MELIAAIATAQIPSAVGIVRLSGEGTRDALAALFTPANGVVVSDLPYRRMTYGDVRDETGALLDRCMAVCFSAAHSYTGEESAEIHMVLPWCSARCCAPRSARARGRRGPANSRSALS